MAKNVRIHINEWDCRKLVEHVYNSHKNYIQVNRSRSIIHHLSAEAELAVYVCLSVRELFP